MGNKFPARGDFSLPAAIFDEYDWTADWLIDGPIGQIVTLVFPPKPTQCDNCKLDVDTGRSSGIYNGSGPFPFTNHTVCPRCMGEGRYEADRTSAIRMRLYWTAKDWVKTGVRIVAGECDVMAIGYMSDLPALKRAKAVIMPKDIEELIRYRCERVGKAIPWGFRQKRYFLQFFKQMGE
jgi:hypothetical protein